MCDDVLDASAFGAPVVPVQDKLLRESPHVSDTQQSPKSFSFGEGCLVTQSAFAFVFSSVVGIGHDVDDPTTDFGSFAIIGKIGCLACLVLCALTYIPPAGSCSRRSLLGRVKM